MAIAVSIFNTSITLKLYHSTQGAKVASVKPEYLMEPADYKMWVKLQKEMEARKNKSGHRETKLKTEEEEAIEDQLYEAVSKRAWTDVLLQLLKVRSVLWHIKWKSLGVNKVNTCHTSESKCDTMS